MFQLGFGLLRLHASSGGIFGFRVTRTVGALGSPWLRRGAPFWLCGCGRAR